MHRKHSHCVCNKYLLFQMMIVLIIITMCILGLCTVLFGMDTTLEIEPVPIATLHRDEEHLHRSQASIGAKESGSRPDTTELKTNKVLIFQKAKKHMVKIKHKKMPKKRRMHNEILMNNSKSKNEIPRKMVRANRRCPDVLKLASVGKWKRRKMSIKEHKYMDIFLTKARKQLSIVPTISRKDGKCGNVSLPYRIARALCDPKGKTPCCLENKCTALPVDKCRCSDCYDMRQRIYAEYATWIPSDKRCRLKNFTAEEACRVLSGTQLYLIGDSYMRNLYSVFLMILRNDGIYGAQKPSLNNDQKNRCGGVYAIGSKECRPYRDSKPGPLCNGTFKMAFVSHSKSAWAPALLQLVSGSLRKKGVVLLAGLGTHENYNSTKIQAYLSDAVKLLAVTNVKWPKLLWATNHAPGLLKSLVHRLQDYQHVQTFNKDILNFLRPYDVPVFDTFGMSKDLLSFDGSHYGLGLCLTKAQLYLNYVNDMKSRGLWS